MPESFPPLRCEIRRPQPELRWLTWGLSSLILLGTLVDALWVIPAQRRAQAAALELAPARVQVIDGAPRATRVDGVLLIKRSPTVNFCRTRIAFLKLIPRA